MSAKSQGGDHGQTADEVENFPPTEQLPAAADNGDRVPLPDDHEDVIN